MRSHAIALVLICVAISTMAGCGHKTPPVVNAPPPPAPAAFPAADGPASPTSPPEPPAVPAPAAIRSTPLLPWNEQSVDAINGPTSPLQPAFFAYDSDQLDAAAQRALAADATVLKTYATWVITIEGHCDERGTAEYNLALGDRRAEAAKNYLVSLGIAAERMRTVSYGNEFPFESGHTESAWAKNRRAHVMLTSK